VIIPDAPGIRDDERTMHRAPAQRGLSRLEIVGRGVVAFTTAAMGIPSHVVMARTPRQAQIRTGLWPNPSQYRYSNQAGVCRPVLIPVSRN